MDAQAVLRLCSSQNPKDRFSRVEAHILIQEERASWFIFCRLTLMYVSLFVSAIMSLHHFAIGLLVNCDFAFSG